MKKHKFTDAEHFAIWRAYGQKCFYCEQPLAFAEITIDHLIKLRLIESKSLPTGAVYMRYMRA